MAAVEGFDTSRPNIARVYDYWLGGKDHYPADRELAEKIREINPGVPAMARDNRAFALAAVTRAAENGIAQFLDLGAGLPTRPAICEAARAVNPAARIAYVDFDPVVINHATALLANKTGIAAALADLTDPDAVLAHPAVTEVIDLDQPLCIVFASVLHFLDADTARRVTAEYASRAAAGSELAVSVVHVSSEQMLETPASVYTAGTFFNHGEPDITTWLSGWELLPPGVAEARRWVAGIEGSPAEVAYLLCAVAAKPWLRLPRTAQLPISATAWPSPSSHHHTPVPARAMGSVPRPCAGQVGQTSPVDWYFSDSMTA
jgi:S-adenosyl methyltransferase